MNSVPDLDRSFLALSHPVRRAILGRLAAGPATVGVASGGLGVSKPAVTKHLKVLEEAGVVSRSVSGRTHVLRLEPRALRDASSWLELHRGLWEAKFEAVEQHLRAEEETMSQTEQETVLHLEHRFAAPRERVFDAFVNPDVLRRWWAASPTWDTPTADVDAREGGSYRLSMRTDAGDVHTVSGEYREVRPPERLAYTWSWEEGPDPVMAGSEATLVEIDFVDDGGATLVRLTHSGFASEQVRDMHTQGWQGVLANLEARVFS